MFGEYLSRIIALIHMITALGLTVQVGSIDGVPQNIYTIEANPSYTVDLIQVLSYNQVSGYDTLTSMYAYDQVEGSQGPSTILGVNGMFYDGYGRPNGIVIIDGEVVKSRSLGTPVFIQYANGQVDIMNLSIQAYLVSDDFNLPIYEVNEAFTNQYPFVLSKWYGRYYDLLVDEIGLEIRASKTFNTYNDFQRMEMNDNSIKLDSFQIVYRAFDTLNDTIEEAEQMHIEFESDLDLSTIDNAFQTGGWLVDNGINIAKDFESTIGWTNSRQPRTAIGITEDGNIVVKVIDGRQPDVSLGLTGYELAELMISEGCMKAAYLDGGSSSAMLLNGSLISKPSGGEEKLISHGLFFKRESVAN